MTLMRLGTRGSPLALAQTNAVANRLRHFGAEVEIVPIRTEGDRLLDGAVDAAVHSLKDLPAEVPAGLALAAFPEREDPRDVLVTRTGARFEDLPPGAVIGTSSPRRRAIVLALRPDLVVEPIRGNVDTRLRKLESGGWDGVILAAAGLHRLGLAPAHARPLAPDVFVPAVGQGILALEVRESDGRSRSLVERLDHAATRACALAERAYLARLGASCNTPMAAHAAWSGDRLTLTAFVASEDGRKVLRGADSGAPQEAARVGRRLAESLLERGAAAVAALRV